MEDERIITSGLLEEDADSENSLRPKKFEDYIGQEKVKELIITVKKMKMNSKKNLKKNSQCYTIY